MDAMQLRIITNQELLSHLKALALAHCAGNVRSDFSDGFLTGLFVVATLTDVGAQFKNEMIQIQRRQPKMIEVKK